MVMDKPRAVDFQPIPSIPPQNLEVEAEVLGGCLVDPVAFSRISDVLSPKDFYLASHQHIYKAMVDLSSSQRPIDLMSVAIELADNHLLDSIGGQSYLAQLYECVSQAVNIDLYAGVLLRKSRDRQIIAFARSAIQLAHQSHLTDEEVISQFTEGFNKILSISVSAKGELRPMSEIADEGLTTLENLTREGRPPGVRTGLRDLDAMTGGFQRGVVSIIAGRPSMGKTAMAFEAAFNMARSGHSVAIFSLETPCEQIFFRALSARTSIPATSIQNGTINGREWEAIGSCYNEFSSLPLYIDDSRVGISDIENRIERIQQKTGRLIDAIVIDHVALMKGVGLDPNKEIANISRQLVGIARKYNMAVVLLSQLNRNVESRSDKRPMMADLRDSGALEQDARLVIALYRDEYYNKGTDDRGVAEALVLKHTNGPTGTVKMLFEPQYTRFRDMEHCQ